MPNLDEILLGENFLQQVNKINALIKVMNVTSGLTPSIGDNGNWFIGEIDTGLQAQGPKGNGIHVANASNYETIKAEMHVNDILLTTENIQSIVNIKTNTIGSAPGDLYKLISDDTYEFLGSLIGPSGEQGPSGIAGITPHIGDNGNWFIGDTDTGVAAGGSNVPFVIGTQTAATGAWTGNASTLTELKDGQTIRYWLPYNGRGNATLNLTLKDGTTTGAKYCYYKGTTRLNTQFSSGSMLTLTYRENAKIGTTTYTGWWVDGADNVSTPHVTQYYTTNTNTSYNNVYPLLFKYSSGNTATTTTNGYARYENNLWYNPYAGILHAPKLAENDELLEDKYALKSEIGTGGGGVSGDYLPLSGGTLTGELDAPAYKENGDYLSNKYAPKTEATTTAAGLMSGSDKAKLDGITASADSVSFTRSLTSGTQIGTITINGTGTPIYAPTVGLSNENGPVSITDNTTSTFKSYAIPISTRSRIISVTATESKENGNILINANPSGTPGPIAEVRGNAGYWGAAILNCTVCLLPNKQYYIWTQYAKSIYYTTWDVGS